MKTATKTVSYILVLLVVALAIFYFFQTIQKGSGMPASVFQGQNQVQFLPESKLSFLKIGDTEITVQFARTEEEVEQGLSGTDSLSPDTGMFFVFEQSDFLGFWMNDMSYPIDIIWLDENMRVVTIKNNAKPESYPEIFYPNTKAKYVLEVSAGFSEKNKINVGTLAEFVKN